MIWLFFYLGIGIVAGLLAVSAEAKITRGSWFDYALLFVLLALFWPIIGVAMLVDELVEHIL